MKVKYTYKQLVIMSVIGYLSMGGILLLFMHDELWKIIAILTVSFGLSGMVIKEYRDKMKQKKNEKVKEKQKQSKKKKFK